MFEIPFKSENIAETEKIPDALKSEHLKEGVKPIMTAILDGSNLGESENAIEKIVESGEFVNYDENPDVLKRNNMRNAGVQTYAISDSNEKNKYSRRYWNCTGVAIVGTNKETGEQVSFLSHQDPWKFLEANERDFMNDLSESIKKLKQNSQDGTVDATVFGGHYGSTNEHISSIKK